MARLLTANEIAAARSDPRFRRRVALDHRNRPKTKSEKIFVAALEEAGIAYQYEDSFFPTQYEKRVVRGVVIEVELGHCPDIRITATGDWPEQYFEITDGLSVSVLVAKRHKIINAMAIYPGLVIQLVDYALNRQIEADPTLVRRLILPHGTVMQRLPSGLMAPAPELIPA